MQSSRSLYSPNADDHIQLSGLKKGERASFVTEKQKVETILKEHFGLTDNIVDELVLVVTAAATQAGTVSSLAQSHVAMRQAHEKGMEELNRVLLRHGWNIKHDGNLAYCFSKHHNIIILYQNVDEACNPESSPRNISKRGPQTISLLDTLQFHTRDMFPPQLWLLCSSFDDEGTVNVELSLPKIFSGYYKGFHARLVVNSDLGDFGGSDKQITIDDSFDDEIDEPDIGIL
ncbi:hypothetical protein [Zymobacter palmae]|uniref:hypothetical protein n=1 Tax=Zymobacter palmae TaxID=33074 RepID=UPI0011AE9DCA|nr:hypothetical protein [Zymobacter palmae]